MKLNHRYTFKPYIKWLFFCPHLLQTENGEPLLEDEWPSQDYWDDSSSESEDEQEQVGHRRKVNRAIVLPWIFKNPFQFTCFSNFIYYNVLYLICFNYKYTFKPYIKWLFFCPLLLQTENGEPLPEDEWPSQDYRDDSSSESEDEQEQVGHRRKVNRAIVLPWFF